MNGMMASWVERVASSLSLFFDCVLVLGVAGEVSAWRIGRGGVGWVRVRVARSVTMEFLCLYGVGLVVRVMACYVV